MKSKANRIYLVVAAAVITLTATAHAQYVRVQGGAPAEFSYKIAGGGEQGTFIYEANIESPMIKGAPYTAKAVTTQTQTLADGNKIKHNSEVELARDSEGRTRREQSLQNLGPWQTNEKGSSIVISDPVAHVRWELGPDGGRLLARKMNMFERTRVLLDKAKAEADMKREGHDVGVAITRSEGGPGGAVTVMTSGGENIMRRKMEAEGEVNKNVKVEDLGTQVIEGVQATGTRRTVTIPAGQIGNEQPIVIVSETWFSPELKMTILSKRSDPRIGDTEFRLTNIQRGEPAASLFQVPAEYELRDFTQQQTIRDVVQQKREREF